MKRAIVVTADYRFMSALVPRDAAPGVHVGDVVRVVRDLDLLPVTTVKSGEGGRVVYVDGDSGLIEIELDRPNDDLREWRNCLLVMPFDSEDIIDGFQLATIGNISTAA